MTETLAIQNLHDKYQDGQLITDFRIFCLNECSKACSGCFYNKVNNSVNFKDANKLADELIEQGYDLETCYLLPTDFFDGPDNKKLFDDKDFVELINKFDFFGIAATMDEGDFDTSFLDPLKEVAPKVRIDLQLNIIMKMMFEEEYVQRLERAIDKFTARYPENTVNLAINVGMKFTDEQYQRFEELIVRLSSDKLAEINFTFMARPEISPKMKGQYMMNALPVLNRLSDAYAENGEVKYSDITLFTRPGFVFKDNNIYVAPIIPFDEFVIIQKEDYRLKSPDFKGFLEATANIESENFPIWDKCAGCSNLSQCMGKGYFAIARNLNLPCFLET